MATPRPSAATTSADRNYLLLLIALSVAAAGWLVANAIIDIVLVVQNSIDLTMIGVGLGLTVISLAFRIGQRLQRDTDGLV